MHGRDVRVLQDFLTKVGIRTSVDGQYGPGTTTRVRRWERKSSLKVDGRMTRKDAAILRGQVADGGGALQGNNGGAQPVAPAGEDATLGPDGPRDRARLGAARGPAGDRRRERDRR